MELSVSLQTGGNSAPQLVRSKDGRFRDLLGRFAKRQNSTPTETNQEVQTSQEIAAQLPIVEVATSRPPRRIGQAILSLIRFGMMTLGVIGGTYAVLRLLGCEFVRDDTFEIIINRVQQN